MDLQAALVQRFQHNRHFPIEVTLSEGETTLLAGEVAYQKELFLLKLKEAILSVWKKHIETSRESAASKTPPVPRKKKLLSAGSRIRTLTQASQQVPTGTSAQEAELQKKIQACYEEVVRAYKVWKGVQSHKYVGNPETSPLRFEIKQDEQKYSPRLNRRSRSSESLSLAVFEQSPGKRAELFEVRYLHSQAFYKELESIFEAWQGFLKEEPSFKFSGLLVTEQVNCSSKEAALYAIERAMNALQDKKKRECAFIDRNFYYDHVK